MPQYFLAARISHDTPPAITHLEYFYGFIGVAVAWQFVFLLIGRDPERYRPLMIPAVLEKLAFGVPAIILFAQGQLPGSVLFFGLLDLTLGALFVASWRATAASIARGAQHFALARQALASERTRLQRRPTLDMCLSPMALQRSRSGQRSRR